MRSTLAVLAAWAALACSASAQDRGPDLAAALHLRPDQRGVYVAYLRATALAGPR